MATGVDELTSLIVGSWRLPAPERALQTGGHRLAGGAGDDRGA